MRIKWRVAGFREVRRSPEALAAVRRRAQRIADASGEGYVAEAAVGANRVRAAVITGDFAAILDNARYNTLVRNFDRGR